MSNPRNKRLRELLAREEILVCPCCHDALSATLIEQTGFEATFVSGASVTNTYLGISDVGVMSYGEFRQVIQNILMVTKIPVLVDVDTGYGGVLPIKRMVEEYEQMGVSGIQIEDQIFPKRCAFFGVSVVPEEEMLTRIRAAAAARKDPDFVIVARTDCAKSMGFDEAIRRVKNYYEAGADMVFTSMPPSEEAMQNLQALEIPKCVSYVEGTVTENYTPAEFQQMGFCLVKYPQTLMRALVKTQLDILQEMKRTGTTKAVAELLCSQKTRAEWTHLKEYNDFEEALK